MGIRVMCIGAHPDDCEGSVGGTALLMRERGDEVTFVSVTDGSRGHFQSEYLEAPQLLIARRKRESESTGFPYVFLGVPDGEVYVNRQTTEAIIRLIRSLSPDLVLLNRPNDYHRDHRYSAQMVLDASYMLTVPFLCPDVPALRSMPVLAYWQDDFTEGGAFRADVVVPIDLVIEDKVNLMLCHESQYLEWLPYNDSRDLLSRSAVAASLTNESAVTAQRYGKTRYAEAFQISEYGREPGELAALFPV